MSCSGAPGSHCLCKRFTIVDRIMSLGLSLVSCICICARVRPGGGLKPEEGIFIRDQGSGHTFMGASPVARSRVGELGRDLHNCQGLVAFKCLAFVNGMERGVSVGLAAKVASFVYF